MTGDEWKGEPDLEDQARVLLGRAHKMLTRLELERVVAPPPPENRVVVDPELPTTIEELRNIIRVEVLKILQAGRGK